MESTYTVSTSWKLKFCLRIITRQVEMLHQTAFLHMRAEAAHSKTSFKKIGRKRVVDALWSDWTRDV